MAIIDLSYLSSQETQVPVAPMAPVQSDSESTTTTREPQQDPGAQEDVTLVGVTPDEFALLDSLYQSYLRFLKASKDQSQAAKDLSAAQTAFDACQGETKGAKEAFEVILKSLPEELVKIRDPQARAMIESIREIQESPSHSPANPTLPECAKQAIAASDNYEAWRSLSTQKIVDLGVPGLGKKKAELLVEKFPTIGDLEASRVEAAESRVHWSKNLPKGFGLEVADAIYNAMAGLLREIESPDNTDSNRSIETPDDSDYFPLEVDDIDQEPPKEMDIDINDDEELEYEDFGNDEGIPFDLVSNVNDGPTALEWIESLYNEITEDSRQQKRLWGLNQAGKNSVEWEKGKKAQEDGFEIADCPYSRDREQAARDWLCGWIAASMNMDL
jgi:hypothetical protein